MDKEIGSNGQEEDGKKKKSVLARVLTIIIIILLLLALIVCLIIIFTHRHTMTYYPATAATCTADGNEEFWYCAGCERYFADEEGNTEIEYTDAVIPAAGHTWVGASCDSPRHCSVCGFSDGVALGHDFGEYVSDNNATCTADGTQTATCSRCGETDTKILAGSALGHSYGANLVVSADCIHSGSITRTCTVCGDINTVSVPATGVHDWNFSRAVLTPATGTSEGTLTYTCRNCDETLDISVPATGEHSWQFDRGQVTAVPTCTAAGTIVYPCADCSQKLTITIPVNAGAHSWDEGEVTEPTCTEAGSVVFTCTLCGQTLSATIDNPGHEWQEATCTAPKTCAVCGATEGEALGHDWKDATCTAPQICQTCGITQGEALGHDYKEEVEEADCTKDGSVTLTCSLCGDIQSVTIPATGVHNWDIANVTAPTCTAAGSIEYACSICNATKTEIIPIDSNAHNWDWNSGKVATPATATVVGKITYNCSNEGCNQTLTLDIPAIGVHDWDLEKAVVTLPTCSAEGKIEYACKDCAETLEVAIPVKVAAHNWDSGVLNEPTCTTAGSVVFSCTNANCEETLKVTIPATGVHDWDIANGNVTAPTCTTDGKVVFSCKNCAETLEVTIPAHGHVWVEATCTAPKTCAVCGATEGTELGHKWSGWTAYSDVHMRECETCDISEVEEHDFTTSDTCSRCGATKPAAPATDPFHGVAVAIYDSDSLTVYENGKMRKDLVGNWINSGYYYMSYVSLSGTADSDINISMQLSRSDYTEYLDAYVALKSSDGSTTIEYHPMRWFIEVYQNGAFVPVKFCSGCENCNSCYHANPEDAYDCPTCQNCYYRTMDELQEYLTTDGGLFDLSYSAGETISFEFVVGWDWAFYFDPATDNKFEIRGEDGTRYYFDNKKLTSNGVGSVDNMDSVLAQNPDEADTRQVFDTDGNQWFMQANDISMSADCWLDISVSLK